MVRSENGCESVWAEGMGCLVLNIYRKFQAGSKQMNGARQVGQPRNFFGYGAEDAVGEGKIFEGLGIGEGT